MVVIWDLKELTSGQLLARIPTSCYSLCYLPDSNQLVVGQNFEGIHLISLDDKKQVASMKLTDAAIFDIKSHNGDLFVATGDGMIHHIDLNARRLVRRIAPSAKSARSITLTDDYLIVGFSDHFVRVFDRQHELKVITEFQAHTNSVFAVLADIDHRILVTASRDAHLKAWSMDDWGLKNDVVAHMYAINHIAYSPDKRHFVTCSMDKSIKVWDAETFRLKKVIDKARHAGHGTSVNKLVWMPFQNFLVSCSDDRSIAVWDIKMGDR